LSAKGDVILGCLYFISTILLTFSPNLFFPAFEKRVVSFTINGSSTIIGYDFCITFPSTIFFCPASTNDTFGFFTTSLVTCFKYLSEGFNDIPLLLNLTLAPNNSSALVVTLYPLDISFTIGVFKYFAPAKAAPPKTIVPNNAASNGFSLINPLTPPDSLTLFG